MEKYLHMRSVISVSLELYVSLHELMNTLASRTTLIWSAVDVLQNACRNAAARQALIHTYKVAPILARLLEANLTSEKRMRVQIASRIYARHKNIKMIDGES